MHKLMLVRNCAGLVGFTALVYALKNLPMGLFMIINNTAPFIASTLSWLTSGERMSAYESGAMLVSFTAVCLLATQKPGQDGGSKSWGVTFAVLNAVGMSTVVVCTRRMQRVHHTVVLLSYGVFSAVLLAFGLVVESLFTRGEMRLLHYTKEAWSLMALASTLNSFALSFQTIAMQNERPGFVTLVSYVGLVYAFIGDVVLFDTVFSWVEVGCALVILALNLSVVVYNLRKKC